MFYSYDILGGEARELHAYKVCYQFLVAASGAFEVMLDDGVNRRTVLLNRSYYGLYLPRMIWRQLENFSTNSLALVLASILCTADDYILNYEKFKTWVK